MKQNLTPDEKHQTDPDRGGHPPPNDLWGLVFLLKEAVTGTPSQDWHEKFRAKWDRLAGTVDLVISAVMLAVGSLFFLLFLLRAPNAVWGILTGDLEASREFIYSVALLGFCWAQWHWRDKLYPALRRNAAMKREQASSRDVRP